MNRSVLHCRMAGRMACALAVVFWLSACAQPVRTDSTWHDRSAAAPFARVLVVGVSPELNSRCRFEAFLVSQIRGAGTEAIGSCGAMEPKAPLTREGVEAAVAKYGVDAVVATSLVAAKLGEKEGGTSETRGDAYYKATDYDYGYAYAHGYPFYGLYGVPVAVVYGEFETAPPITSVEGEVSISTAVYETGQARLVYEVNTQARDLSSSAEALAEISTSVSERLRRDGVVR